MPRKDAAVKPKPAVPANGVLLVGAGATFPAVLYDDWFRQYHAANPSRVITYDAVGSGEGIRRFIGRNVTDEERVDFGASDAALRDDEIAAVDNGALLVPLTAGGVALAYNLPDVPDLKLSRQAYAAIFAGLVKSWNDPRIARSNPGVKLPNLTITTVVRQDSSGTTFAFTKHLDAISAEWRAQYTPATLIDWPGNSMRASGNEGVAGRIKQSIGLDRLRRLRVRAAGGAEHRGAREPRRRVRRAERAECDGGARRRRTAGQPALDAPDLRAARRVSDRDAHVGDGLSPVHGRRQGPRASRSLSLVPHRRPGLCVRTWGMRRCRPQCGSVRSTALNGVQAGGTLRGHLTMPVRITRNHENTKPRAT